MNDAMAQLAPELMEKNKLELAPYHRFTVEGRTYAVTIDRFRCTRLDDRTAAFLAAWESDPGVRPEDDVRSVLLKIGLLAADPGKTCPDEASRLERDCRAAGKWLGTDAARTDTLCLMVAQECNMACV